MTPETALVAGIRFGQVFDSVVVIRDANPSSEMIANALESGLMSSGCRVIEAGLTSVPVAHTAFSAECPCIISVGIPDRDGSISGIKAYGSDGTPFDDDRIREILRNEESELPHYDSVGQITRYSDAEKKYIDKVRETGRTSNGYVILDCGCGSTSKCAPNLLETLGADINCFNTHDCHGKLPRSPGVAKSNLLNISNFVNASIGSVGIAFNGDGTRLALMDEDGKYVPGDKLLALLMMYLKPTVAVIPFDSPCIVEDAFNNPLEIAQGQEEIPDRKLIRTENDINSIIEAMKLHNADFGAMTDGTFIFPQMGYNPDALYAAAVLSELAGKRSIRNILESLPRYSERTLRISFDGNMKQFSNRLKERIKEYDVSEVCQLGDTWKMILKKGTYIIKQNDLNPERIIIFAESCDVVYLITMLEQAKDIVKLCI